MKEWMSETHADLLILGVRRSRTKNGPNGGVTCSAIHSWMLFHPNFFRHRRRRHRHRQQQPQTTILLFRILAPLWTIPSFDYRDCDHRSERVRIWILNLESELESENWWEAQLLNYNMGYGGQFSICQYSSISISKVVVVVVVVVVVELVENKQEIYKARMLWQLLLSRILDNWMVFIYAYYYLPYCWVWLDQTRLDWTGRSEEVEALWMGYAKEDSVCILGRVEATEFGIY